MTTRILYFGSRDWIDVPQGWEPLRVKRQIRRKNSIPLIGPRTRAVRDQIQADIREHGPLTIVEGEADGADILSRIIARRLGQEVDPYPVDPAKDGKWPSAGPRRNQRMLDLGRPVAGSCFCEGMGGTEIEGGSLDMLTRLRRAGIPVIVHRDDGIEVDAQLDLFGAL